MQIPILYIKILEIATSTFFAARTLKATGGFWQTSGSLAIHLYKNFLSFFL